MILSQHNVTGIHPEGPAGPMRQYPALPVRSRQSCNVTRVLEARPGNHQNSLRSKASGALASSDYGKPRHVIVREILMLVDQRIDCRHEHPIPKGR